MVSDWNWFSRPAHSQICTITHFMVYFDGWVQGRNSSALAMELRLSCTKPWILFLLAEVWLTVLPSTLTGRYEWVSESPISSTDFIILINRYQIKLLMLIVLWNLWLYHECVTMTYTQLHIHDKIKFHRPKVCKLTLLTAVWPWPNPGYHYSINPLRLRQNGRRFTDDTFKRIFLNENVRISIKISLKFVPKGPIYNIPALVQIMAWHRPGHKPLSEPMIVILSRHICIIRPQWVNTYLPSCLQ